MIAVLVRGRPHERLDDYVDRGQRVSHETDITTGVVARSDDMDGRDPTSVRFVP